jgi:hypothetical protein
MADVHVGLALLVSVREEADNKNCCRFTGKARGEACERIAGVLGLDSRQAAKQRWKRLSDRYPDGVMALPKRLPCEAADDGAVDVRSPD